jgi:hypothetical protein
MPKPKKVVISYDPKDAGRLHCDACGYDLPEKIAFTRDLIGKPCPKCGANMLTEEDFLKTEKMFRFIDGVNRIFGPLFGKTPKQIRENPENPAIQVQIHGDEVLIRRRPTENPHDDSPDRP